MAFLGKYPKFVRADSVTVATGVTTVTLPANTEINDGDVMDILIAVPIPEGTNGTSVTVTNGTITGDVRIWNGNYFRPRPILSRTVLRVQFFADPEHFQLISVRR